MYDGASRRLAGQFAQCARVILEGGASQYLAGLMNTL